MRNELFSEQEFFRNLLSDGRIVQNGRHPLKARDMTRVLVQKYLFYYRILVVMFPSMQP